jgi:diacylglycerol kinase (ATP)
MQTQTRALVIFNPNAGQAAEFENAIEEARQVWQAGGWQVDLQPTSGPGDGTRLAREAAKNGYDIVIAAGGDGTVNEVVNGLVGTKAALGALPIGTVNVWVRELGLPLQPQAAAQALLETKPRTIDVGKAGDRYFLLMSGIGFDAAVTAEVRSEEKKKLGVFAYIYHALDLARRFRGIRIKLTIDGKPIRTNAVMVVVGNSQLYGGFLKITKRASIDDGLLDVCIIKGNSLLGIPLRMLSILLSRASADPKIEYHRARTIRIETQKKTAVQVDGDHIGYTPINIKSVPSQLQALMPDSVPSDLVHTEHTPPRRAWRRLLSGFNRRNK